MVQLLLNQMGGLSGVVWLSHAIDEARLTPHNAQTRQRLTFARDRR